MIHLAIRQCQKDGIWAWDCAENEPVLLIPMVLALLGDNPMQSKFACHIGLKGKLFCRACWAKGTDVLAETMPEQSDSPQSHASHHSDEADAASETGSLAGSETSDGSGDNASRNKRKGRGKRALESMSNMVARVKTFIKVSIFSDFRLTYMTINAQIGRPRCKEETTAQLGSMFEQASTVDTKTKVQNMRTESGVKDTYQMFFLDKLFRSYKKKRGQESKQAALDREIESLPENITSPVWRIKGIVTIYNLFDVF